MIKKRAIKKQGITKEFILNNPYNKSNPYLFKTSYFGLNLYCRLSKNQKRKMLKYGIAPNKPNPSNLILTNKRIKIQKYTSSRYHKQTREKRTRTYININQNLKKINNISFLKKNSKDIVNKELGLLFKITMLKNNVSISNKHREFKTGKGETQPKTQGVKKWKQKKNYQK